MPEHLPSRDPGQKVLGAGSLERERVATLAASSFPSAATYVNVTLYLRLPVPEKRLWSV